MSDSRGRPMNGEGLGSSLAPGGARGLAVLLAAAALAPIAGVYLGLPWPRLTLWATALAWALVWLARGEEIALPRGFGVAAGALVTILAFSSALSTEPAIGLDALTMAVACLALAGAAAQTRRHGELRSGTIDLLLVGGLLAFAGGVLLYPAGAGDLHGLFGNKNHLGGYLALLLPLAASRLLDAATGRQVMAFGATSAILAAGLALSQSRGAWVAGATGVVVALAVAPRDLIRWRRLVAVAVLAALLVVVVDRAAPLISVSAGAAAVTDVTALAAGAEPEGTLAPRLDYWQGAVRIAVDNPVVGVGPGAFAAALPPYLQDPGNYSRYAHQLLLQMSAEAGLPGLAALVVLLAVTAAAVGKALRTGEGPERALTAGLAGGLAASLLHNLVDLDWYVPAIAVTASVAAGLATAGAPADTFDRTARRLAGVAIVLALMWTGMRSAETAAMDQAARVLTAGDAPAAAARYELAASANVLSGAPRVAVARLALTEDGVVPPVSADRGIAAAREAVQRSRLDVEAKSVLAALLQQRGGAGDAEESVRLLRAAAALRQPSQAAAIYAALGRALWSQGRLVEAEQVYRQVGDAFPLLPPPALDAAAVSEAHVVLGNLASSRRDLGTAAREYRLGLAADPGNAAGHFNLGVVYVQLGDAESATVHLERALTVGPDLAVGRFYLGVALAMSGDNAGAREQWRHALALDPACNACRQELERTGGL